MWRWLMVLAVAGCGGNGGGAAVDAAADVAARPQLDAAEHDAATLGTGCRAMGGTCVPGKWAACPRGQEPTADVHADCKPATATRGYFCCVPAPASPCSDSAGTNCFSGTCHTCWGPVSTLACESGRTCCNYQCTD